MSRKAWIIPLLAACTIVMGLISCGGNEGATTPGPNQGSHPAVADFKDVDPGRHMIGLWRWDLAKGKCEAVDARSAANHINVADLLLMPEYAKALKVTFDTFAGAGKFAPPAVKVTATLSNLFNITGWNVRGIVIDDSGLLALNRAEGYTAQWDIGSLIPLNPFMVFALDDGSFPDSANISKDFMLEAQTNNLPPSVWFAVDVGTDGLIRSATHFPLAAVNGSIRYDGDQAPMVCRLKDPLSSIVWVAAATKPFAGGATILTDKGFDGEYREWTGNLNYAGGQGGGDYPLYFEAWSKDDIPTLSATMVHIDPGPFASGPADSGCSQRCYDPARTCRSKGSIAKPLTDWVLKPPNSASGLALTTDMTIVRRLECFRSLALQYPGKNIPEWTRLVGESDTISSPAVGDDGTIFCLEPDQGLLRALRPDGTERWTYSFTSETHGDLVLTSSPLGGLLITIVRKDGSDIAIVAVGTDGHLRWQFNLSSRPLGSANERRLAVSPGGMLYYTIPTGGVMALNTIGEIKWATSKAGWESTQDPIAGDDDRVFCLSNDGTQVACFNATGGTIWTHPMASGEHARYPSLDYNGNLFVVIDANGDTDAIDIIDGGMGVVSQRVIGATVRGNVAHGTNGDYVWVQRDSPIPEQPHCDDFFVCNNPSNVMSWWINTPGVSQTGAYPVVDKCNNIYVQGPDGMYMVTL